MYNAENLYEILSENQDLTVNNRIFCTFSPVNRLDNLLGELTRKYSILYNKIFILSIKDSEEYACTYNIDSFNINDIPEDTILVHRKKESNTLYSLNGLNEVIKKSNGGIVDHSYRIDWQQYKNSILLTQKGELRVLNTKLYKIIETQ